MSDTLIEVITIPTAILGVLLVSTMVFPHFWISRWIGRHQPLLGSTATVFVATFAVLAYFQLNAFNSEERDREERLGAIILANALPKVYEFEGFWMSLETRKPTRFAVPSVLTDFEILKTQKPEIVVQIADIVAQIPLLNAMAESQSSFESKFGQLLRQNFILKTERAYRSVLAVSGGEDTYLTSWGDVEKLDALNEQLRQGTAHRLTAVFRLTAA